MHFSKTYSQLLQTLPPELRENAIQYRQLKRLINQLVQELSSLGLSPTVLQQLLEQQNPTSLTAQIEEIRQQCDRVSDCDGDHQRHATVVYEFIGTSSHIEPRLRLSIKHPIDATDTASGHTTTPDSILEALQLHSQVLESNKALVDICYSSTNTHDLIIPLRSDTAFFHLLNTALASLAEHLNTVHGGFTSTLQSLAYAISATARPTSSSARSFSTYSMAISNAATLRPSSGSRNTDLYSWREIFQMYVESEIFESVGERARGERSVEETETRMKQFEKRMQEKRNKLKLAGSKDALDVFMRMNFFILDLKRFQFANAEATRKILKKHTKRTALPLPPYLLPLWNGPLPASPPSTELALLPWRSPVSLPRLLVQAIGEILLPVVPHVDDYSCLICTSLAFKPIRLGCGHLFCVRCLVKLQKLGKANCPICRAPTVLKADRTNVDYALLNFMADWFPLESRVKLSTNEREAAKEELEELGLSGGCRVM